MAKNFRVFAKKGRNHRTALKLSGDFDASSAYELIHVIDKSVKKNRKVSIDTDGLKMINSFGLDVFLPQMSSLNSTRADIQVTGRFSGLFREE